MHLKSRLNSAKHEDIVISRDVYCTWSRECMCWECIVGLPRVRVCCWSRVCWECVVGLRELLVSGSESVVDTGSQEILSPLPPHCHPKTEYSAWKINLTGTVDSQMCKPHAASRVHTCRVLNSSLEGPHFCLDQSRSHILYEYFHCIHVPNYSFLHLLVFSYGTN
jgi:hypothetical protein